MISLRMFYKNSDYLATIIIYYNKTLGQYIISTILLEFIWVDF